METGNINAFYIGDEIKIRNNVTRVNTAFLTSASETEFKDLVSNYLTKNLIQLISYSTCREMDIFALFWVKKSLNLKYFGDTIKI